MDDNYIKSLHYCPMCGTVIGCGEGGCDSRQFQDHIARCREAGKKKHGRIRYTEEG